MQVKSTIQFLNIEPPLFLSGIAKQGVWAPHALVGEEGGGVADLAALGLRQEQVHEHEEGEQQQAERQHDEAAQVGDEHSGEHQSHLNM